MRCRLTRTSLWPPVAIFIIILGIGAACLLWFAREEPTARDEIIRQAKQHLGEPYRYGGSKPGGFDCSGFVMYLFQQQGKALPRTADKQATVGKPVQLDKLRPGDIVCFATDEPAISHTGLYIGDNNFIHASSSAKKVIISDLLSPYWQKAFRGGRQLIP